MSDNITQEIYDFLTEKTDEVSGILTEYEAVEAKIKNRDEYTQKVINERFIPVRDELKMKISSMSENAIREAGDKVKAYRQEIAEANRLNPKELTDDVKLLQPGIVLNAEDLKGMLDRNANNRTMTQIILRYAKEHNITLDLSYIGGQSELATADQLDEILFYYKNWIGKPEARATLDSFFGVK